MLRLPAAWPEKGLPKLWESEPIPTYNDGGLGSPVVAEGRVFVYSNWKYPEPIATRTLHDDGLRRLGWTPEKPAPDLLTPLETARASDERAALAAGDVGKWAEAWLAANVKDEEVRKKLGGWMLDRLRRGRDAFALAALDTLATGCRGQTFATQAELDAWLAANAIDGKLKEELLKVIPTTRERADDVVLCFAADTGALLWRAKLPGEPRGWDNSGTPCVRDGRLYVLASGGAFYCLSTADGSVVWKGQAAAGGGSSSPALRDGKLFVVAGQLTAYSVADGGVLWKQPGVGHSHTSPVFWVKDGVTRMLCNAGNELACVNPEDGALLWKASPGGHNSTPVLSGDIAVVQGEGSGLTAYRLTPEKPEQLWNLKHNDRGSSPVIRDGHVYVVSANQAKCVKLETGEVVWEEKIPGQEISSPILVGDRVLAFVGGARQLWSFQAVPEKLAGLLKTAVDGANCSSPAIVGTRLFLRTNKGVACYDLAPPPPAAPAAP